MINDRAYRASCPGGDNYYSNPVCDGIRGAAWADELPMDEATLDAVLEVLVGSARMEENLDTAQSGVFHEIFNALRGLTD